MNNPVRYFIADIHLTDSKPAIDCFDITAGFLSFLDTLPDHCELYILGDLFDYWVGADVNSPLHEQIANALNSLSSRHIKKYFVHGNRDFLLGKKYADLCDMTLLPAVNLLSAQEKTVVFLHGDLLCTDDVQYQKFRKKMHCKWLQRLFLLLPLFVRQKIAGKLRATSSEHNQIKSDYIMDVNQQAVAEMMTQYHANIMIHGHTHKPAIHEFDTQHKAVKRVVLGAWHDGVSYVKCEADGNIELYSHSFK